MRQFFVFDIGGTEIKYGVVNAQGEILVKSKMPSRGALGGKQILDDIVAVVKTLSLEYKGEGIAISSAGVINSDTGEVLSATNAIVDFIGLNVIKYLNKRLNLPVSVMNDVNSMALCEYHKGAGIGSSSMVAMTVGTGIGGAILLNGQLIQGHGYSAGEFGLMRIESNDYEAIASTSSLVRAAQQELGESIQNGIDVFNLYDQKDAVAIKLVNRFYDNLSIGIANIAYAFNPEVIVIGGGITGRDQFISELMTYVKPKLNIHLQKHTQVKAALFKNDAGMIGAFYHFLNQYPQYK
ncbi:MAG: ROK family protein [Candidatus Moranbacteria bacterium]|jgi:predicted NBD/HSP70 family sugar kinase|nr:ROK family protein [Candidatus Moranbacteria bacterium]